MITPHPREPKAGWSKWTSADWIGWHLAFSNMSNVWHTAHTLKAHQQIEIRPRAQRPLLLLGDSITERLHGTRSVKWGSLRVDQEMVESNVRVLMQSRITDAWGTPFAMGITGDQTTHLLWALAHGQLSSRLAVDQSLVISLLIGTNDLGDGRLQPETAAGGVIQVVAYLLKHTHAAVLVNSLLPRVNPARSSCWGLHRGPIHEVNVLLRNHFGNWTERTGFVECGHVFASANSCVNISLMLDGLHPHGEGYTRMLECLTPSWFRLAESWP